jgi:hypothetical protein
MGGLTGLSRESARFQPQSAFLGVAFTIRELEPLLFLSTSGPDGWLPWAAGLIAGTTIPVAGVQQSDH